jgi:hypothetical protein
MDQTTWDFLMLGGFACGYWLFFCGAWLPILPEIPQDDEPQEAP